MYISTYGSYCVWSVGFPVTLADLELMWEFIRVSYCSLIEHKQYHTLKLCLGYRVWELWVNPVFQLESHKLLIFVLFLTWRVLNLLTIYDMKPIIHSLKTHAVYSEEVLSKSERVSWDLTCSQYTNRWSR